MHATGSIPRRTGRSFTLVELLCVLAIVALLAALVLTGTQRALLEARRTASLANLRTIGTAFAAYLSDNDGRYPAAYTGSFQTPFWTDSLIPYVGAKQSGKYRDWSGAPITLSPPFIDPLLPNGRHTTLGDYGANSAIVGGDSTNAPVGLKAAALLRPAETVLALTMANKQHQPNSGYWLLISAYWASSPSYYLCPDDRGTGNILCLFADGHTQDVATNDFMVNRNRLLLNAP